MEEKSSGAKPIEGVSTSVAAFIGVTEKGPVGKTVFISNFAEFVKRFGGPIKIIKKVQEHYLYYAVRHFFSEGGTKCYIVRALHYTDVDDETTNTGVAASRDFDGRRIDSTAIDGTAAVSNALKVSAINEGKWGENLEVQVENSSKYSLLLGKAITGTDNFKEVSLEDNSEVQIGDLLWIVEEVTGVVKSVSTTNEITFSLPLRAGTNDLGEPILFTGPITNAMTVFTPDFKLITTTGSSGPVSVTNGIPDGTPPPGITLADIDGVPLKSGDLINFVINAALVVVKKISQKEVAGETVMVVEFAEQNFSTKNFPKNRSRVYARGFNITVRDKDSGTLLETHENLSLIEANLKDRVSERLPVDSGGSFYITAARGDSNAVLPNNTAFEELKNGDNGLSGLANSDYIGSELLHTGLFALDTVKDASILVLPNSSQAVTLSAIGYCEARQDLFFVMDYPNTTNGEAVDAYRKRFSSKYAAIYYPWIKINDPFTGRPLTVPPSGAVAGIYADTDVKRGVHKAPAGVENGYVNAASGIEKIVTKGENDILYQEEVNVIRKLPEGILVWGARTISADAEWKYINVRRLFIFLEQSIEHGTQWVVFEPNGPSLWKSIKRNISAFLKIQWMEGKLVGDTQEQAFYVKCDEETNPPEVVDAGQVVTEIGVAPSKPAEFVVFRIRQFAGRSAA
jgi:phage tail sheath protein FI